MLMFVCDFRFFLFCLLVKFLVCVWHVYDMVQYNKPDWSIDWLTDWLSDWLSLTDQVVYSRRDSVMAKRRMQSMVSY